MGWSWGGGDDGWGLKVGVQVWGEHVVGMGMRGGGGGGILSGGSCVGVGIGGVGGSVMWEEGLVWK